MQNMFKSMRVFSSMFFIDLEYGGCRFLRHLIGYATDLTLSSKTMKKILLFIRFASTLLGRILACVEPVITTKVAIVST